jgi:nitroreductase
MALSAVDVKKLKEVPPVEGVLPIFHQRWSARSFSHQDVSPPELRKVFEAARWAASSNNEQPWRFIVGTRNSLTHQKIFESLVAFNKAWAGSAPVLILGVASSRFTQSGAANGYAMYDLGAAASYLTLQAAALGLTTHQMGGYDRDAARKALEIPEDYALGSVIALGFQGEPEALANEQLIERELSLRSRKPLSELVFSAWGETANLD